MKSFSGYLARERQGSLIKVGVKKFDKHLLGFSVGVSVSGLQAGAQNT